MRRSLMAAVVAAAAIFTVGLRAATVALTWVDNANNEDGFRVERSTSGAAAGFVEIAGSVAANATTYTDALVAPATTYWYRVRAFNAAGNSGYSNVATVTTPAVVTLPAGPSGSGAVTAGSLVNVSNRGLVTAGDATTIPGFVIAGGPLKVLVRAVGPSLAQFNVPGVCADPMFTLRDQAGIVMATSDNWSGQVVIDAAAATGAFPLPVGSKDAALVITLPPGQYTAVVTGVGGATGIVLAEVFVVP